MGRPDRNVLFLVRRCTAAAVSIMWEVEHLMKQINAFQAILCIP
jgi:hypothetical protein